MSPTTSLAGQTALVTGGGRGIGKAIALALGEAGAEVVVNYSSSAAAADEVVTAIEAIGGRLMPYRPTCRLRAKWTA